MIKMKFLNIKNLKKLKPFILPSFLFVILIFLIFFSYSIFISDKYYPITFVGDTNISFLTEGQAIRKLQSRFDQRQKEKLIFSYPQGSFTIDLATSSASIDYSSLSSELINRQEDTLSNKLKVVFSSLFLTYQITPNINLDLEKQAEVIQSSVEKSPINAQLIFDETANTEGTPSARIQIKDGSDGLSLDKEKLISNAINYILTGKYNLQLPIKSTPPKITTQQLVRAKAVLEKIYQEPVKLIFNPSANSEQFSWILDAKQLLVLLDLTNGTGQLLDKDKTNIFLEKIASEIDQEVQEGLFEFNPNTKRVSAFRPSFDGRKLDIDKTFHLLTSVLTEGNTKSINLPVEIVKPKIQTSDVNSLGIKELLGSGVSHFAGSIPNRIYNVGLTASKINGVLIPPGEIFSFNQTVGDISAATGFKQAYVIKEGRTVLDDGGGVCQDSTTLFRAVLNAGLPVIKRTAHAYRVSYYEQGFPPGLDATIYYPSVDFQFKNDTTAHILIQAYTSGTTLYIDLYGTPDGRASSITTPIISNQTPPPPELRQDDPTLPKGTIKQVDWAAWGAKVTFKRTVTRNGEILSSENWVSNYKPWQAVYLVGTKEN